MGEWRQDRESDGQIRAKGLEGLKDRPRAGRPARYSAEEKVAVMALDRQGLGIYVHPVKGGTLRGKLTYSTRMNAQAVNQTGHFHTTSLGQVTYQPIVHYIPVESE